MRSGSLKITNIITTKHGTKKVEVHLTKEDEIHLLEYALSDLMNKGAVSIIQERERFLLDIPPGGNA